MKCVLLSAICVALFGQVASADWNSSTEFSFTNDFSETIYKDGTINKSKCVFEYIYFMKESTHSDNVSVKNWRVEIGKRLVKQTDNLIKNLDKKNTLVCGIPSSGIVYGESYSYYSGLDYCQFLKKKFVTPEAILPKSFNRLEFAKSLVRKDVPFTF